MPVADYLWSQISLDFITGLPTSDGKDSILTVICQLSKMRHYIPCSEQDNGTSAESTAMLLVKEVIRLYGLPDRIISDRGPQFISTLYQALCQRLQIDARLSTARHPETDGQSERANQDIKTGLRAYVNYLQDD